ncbi:hypothetical protein B0T24DRAFT_615420 [Lasiosphaeria ovina]|uniref:Regulatory P domain-containing protein n=1 Tax=Lasiosphaeria ovina TaxID=92902 RepID=A0AAE0NFC5_9PEZI|nr:hypothetical protein B0T24DRAFT_615420 [Lasiosphaeria ovina]
MRLTSVASAVALGAAVAAAKELPKDERLGFEVYDSGAKMDEIMAIKLEHWQAELAAGAWNSSQWPRLGYTKCVNGVAEAIKGDPLNTFRCKNVDLYDFINHATLGSPMGQTDGSTGSSTWGWTDPKSGREFIASGMYQGTAFIEILPIGKMLHVGFLPCPAPLGQNALWKEIRPYKNYILIGSELVGHGIQIFDMTKLLSIDARKGPHTFSTSDVTGHFTDLPLGRTHNVVINQELGYGVAVGAAPRTDGCRAGLIFFDLTDPSKPTRLGCDGQDGYVHDAQCLVYRGPDTRYQGRDICYGYNEDTLTIYDVTNKTEPTIISRTSYEGASYTHQGWVLDVNNQEYLLLDDEYDEYDVVGPGTDGYPVTYIWDIRNLQSPKNTGLYKGTTRAIDHNQYVIDGLSYQSNYMAGLRVYDVSSIPADPTGGGVCEIAFFDIFPEDDSEPGGGAVEFSGTWASYAYFKSGFIFVNTIERGAFLVKITKREKCKAKSCNADNCLRALRSETNLAASQQFCGGFTKTYVADVAVVPAYAQKACTTNIISRVSSACSCLPAAATATAP